MTMVSTDYLRFVLALVLVLGLIALFAWLIKRFRIGAFAGGAGSGRLRVVESLALDPRQRLVIIRRDDLEHLILIGPDGGRLIEGGIQAAATGARLDHAQGEPGS
jgi:flagellar protein FliO/FliZ